MGGRGGSSGLSGGASSRLPSYDTKSMADRMSSTGPALSGSPKQVSWANDIRDEAHNAMVYAVMDKHRIDSDVLADIAQGKTAMKKGVVSAYKKGLEISGNKSVAQEWAIRRADTYKKVSDDLKKIDSLRQSQTSASWWIANRNPTQFRKYITSGKSFSEMERSGWFIKR